MKIGNKKLKKWIFLSSLCFVAFILMITNHQGKSQDKELLADYILYQEALNSYEEGDYEQAFKNYQKLLRVPRYHSSIELNLQMARTEIERQNHEEAIKYYEKVKRKYTAIVLDKGFLDEYAWQLFVEDDERYKKYFERLKS